MLTRIGLTVALALVSSPGSAQTAAQHQAMVLSHGAQVMPFDEHVAMHMFTPNSLGGTLEVMVHNMNPKQIESVRAHLRSEAAKFAVGDYSDAAYIHGKTMPGLDGMEKNVIAVRYSDTRMGGQIVFWGSNPEGIQSVHKWLASQTSDHAVRHRKCDMKM